MRYNRKSTLAFTTLLANCTYPFISFTYYRLALLVCNPAPGRWFRCILNPFSGGKVMVILLHGDNPWDIVKSHGPYPEVFKSQYEYYLNMGRKPTCIIWNWNNYLKKVFNILSWLSVDMSDEISWR